MGGHPEQQRGRGLWFTGRKRAGNQDAPGGQRPSRGRQARMATIAGCGAAAIALVVGACGSSGSSSSSGGTKQAGGVATYALPPSTTPNYIFPMSNSTYFSVANISYLQAFLYRPLYWFGNGTQPTLNPSLSLADQPVYNGKQVTITLKNYKWSDGTQVTAQNVLFWINMLQAVGQTEWGAFVPGGFPTNVTNVKATSPTTLTMTMNKAYSPTWFTYNELSQITPMPKAWDRTASGPSNCTTTVSDCKAVYTYLDSQSKSMSTYASSPVWGVVDGPWKLQSLQRGRQRHLRAEQVLLRTGQADAGAVQGGAVHHGGGRVQRAPLGQRQPEAERRLPADDRRPEEADRRHDGREPGVGVHARPAVLLGHQLLRAQHRLHDPRGPGHQAAVLPAGAGLPGQPGGGHLRPAARVRHHHERTGGRQPGDQLPVCPEQDGTRSPTIRPRPSRCCPATAGR